MSGLKHLRDGSFDTSGLAIQRVDVDDLLQKDKKGKSGDDEFLAALTRMQQQAQAQSAASFSGGATLKSLDADFSGLASDLGVAETGVDKLIREAKQLIAASRHKEAFKPLGEALRESPRHHEGLYLAGVCHNALNEPEQALRVIAPLRNDPTVTNRHARKVRELRGEIRAKLMNRVVLEFVMYLQRNALAQAVGRLQELLELDAEAWLLHYLLAGSLMKLERLNEARAAIDRGMQQCAVAEQAQLEPLQKQILAEVAREQLAPARKLFKEGKYRPAQQALQRVEAAVQMTPLCKCFAVYLSELLSKGRGRADVARCGDAKDVDALCWFLLGEEIRQVKDLLGSKKLVEAEQVVQRAHQLLPNYPYINYLYGCCTYHRMGTQLASGKPPALEDLLDGMKRARDLAEVGAKDAEIEDAPNLLQATSNLVKQLTGIQQEIEERKREAKPVNDAIGEFQAIMESIKGGIGSERQRSEVHNRMRALSNRLGPLAKQVRSDEGKQAVKQLQEAVANSLQRLENLQEEMQEAEPVKELWNRLETKTEELKRRGGVKSYAEAEALKGYMRQLRTDAQQQRRRLRSEGARKAVDNLLSILQQILKQLGD